MKILMVTDYFLPHVGGGVEKVVYEVSLSLVRGGHKVQVVTLNTDNAAPREVIEGIGVRRAVAINLTSVIGMQLSISQGFHKLIREEIMQMRPDVVHAHNLFFYTTLVTTQLRRKMRFPLVTTLHLGNLDYLTGARGVLASKYECLLGRWILRNSDRVTAVSRRVAEHAAILGMETSGIDVIPNGVDREYFEDARHADRDNRCVVSVGRLIFNKGLQFLVDAAPRVLERYPDAQFVIVGDGPMLPELQRRAREMGVDGHFVFTGRVDDVRSFLSRASVFVRPSLFEGMPLTILEAMASGLPVIASDVGGTSELVRNNVTGLLIRPGDVEALSASIVELFSDPELCRRLASNARQAVGSFSWKSAAELYLKAYERVAGRVVSR